MSKCSVLDVVMGVVLFCRVNPMTLLGFHTVLGVVMGVVLFCSVDPMTLPMKLSVFCTLTVFV